MLNLDTKPFGDFPTTMCDPYSPASVHHPDGPLDDFQTLLGRKFPSTYTNFYTDHPYDTYRMDLDAAASVYHELHSSPKDAYASPTWKQLESWTNDDVIGWLIDVAQNPMAPIHESEIPLIKFKGVTGYELKAMSREDMRSYMHYPGANRESSRQNADVVYAELDRLRSEHCSMQARETVLRTALTYPSYGDSNLQDFDNQMVHAPYPDYSGTGTLATQDFESGDDSEDRLRQNSPEYSYGSDASQPGDEKVKSRVVKRPPGRPPGPGKKQPKCVKNVSVPQFLSDLLRDPTYCPAIIKWERYEIGQFRFVKPDEVSKLWGCKKNNKNMSFEKFSRAMRYHYKNEVLKSVPTARLVYQFGDNGKHLINRTDDPNFEHFKIENTL